MRTSKNQNLFKILIIILVGIVAALVIYIVSIFIQSRSFIPNKIDLINGYFITYPTNWLVNKEGSVISLSKNTTKIQVAITQVGEGDLNNIVNERLSKISKVNYQITDTTLKSIPFKKIDIQDQKTENVFKDDKLFVYAGLIDGKYYVTFSISYSSDAELLEAQNLVETFNR